MILFLKLAIAHFFFDYPGQGDFLAKAKNHTAPIPGVPWYQALIAHSAIQAGAVWYLTGDPLFGCVEFCIHAITDYYKCDGRISYNVDQLIHLTCKALYALTLYQ